MFWGLSPIFGFFGVRPWCLSPRRGRTRPPGRSRRNVVQTFRRRVRPGTLDVHRDARRRRLPKGAGNSLGLQDHVRRAPHAVHPPRRAQGRSVRLRRAGTPPAASGEREVRTRRPDAVQQARPKPFTLPLRIPPVVVPRRCTTARTATGSRSRRRRLEILPGYQTTVWGYNGIVPGPTSWSAGPQDRQARQQPAAAAPASATRRGPRCTCTARRRCRSTTATPATSRNPGQSRTTATRTSRRRGRSGTTTTACTTPPRTCSWAWPASTTCTTPLERSLPMPQGEFDVPLIVSRRDVRRRRVSCCSTTTTTSGMYGDVILVNGVPWPVMKVKRRKYRFRSSTPRSRAPTSGRCRHRRPDHGDRHRRRPDAGPQTVTSFRHGMAERYEVVDRLREVPARARGSCCGTRSPKNNIDFANTDKIMAFDVVGDDVRPDRTTTCPRRSTRTTR